ncbi:MAG TPA: hypothetical protein VIC24_05145 [Gemmatimonadaceae bacterium]|jgi:hypothetical protein
MTRPAARPRIAALLPYVWSVRNVVYGGVLDRLTAAGADVHLVLRHGAPPVDHPAAGRFAAASEIHELLELPSRPIRGKALLDAVIRSGFNRRYGIASYPIYRRWFEREWSVAQRGRAAGVEMLGAIAQRKPVMRRLRRAAERWYREAHDITPVRAQLERMAPSIVWSTFCVTPLEYPYYLAARDLGIPIVTSILSFDNLTSRSAIPPYDHYFVWHEGMRAQLLRLYPDTPRDRVTVTGTPQFDFHRDPAYRRTRDETLGALGLPADARYVLYAASFVGLAPDEPLLVRRLAERMHASPRLRGLSLVVRIHPLETRERWRTVTDVFPNVVVQTAWETPPDRDGWTLSTPNDQARLVSALAHAEMCVNVASTMSLDAALLDRPVIGIDFSTEPDAPRGIMYEEYGVEHYRPLVERGGLRVAKSWNELTALMESAIAEPSRDRLQRAQMIEYECGRADGCAADRLTSALLRAAGHTTMPATLEHEVAGTATTWQ